MVAVAEICGKAAPNANDIAAVINVCKNPLDQNLLNACLKTAHDEYAALGANDKVAKGNDFQNNLKKALQTKYPTASPTPNLPGLSPGGA